MKNKLIYILLSGAMMSSIISCTKDYPDDPVEHIHTLVHVSAIPHTATENGCYEHWKCASCGETFADAEGTVKKPMVIDWADDVMQCSDEVLCAFDDNGQMFDVLGKSMGSSQTNSSFASSLINTIIVKSLFAIMDKVFDYTHEQQEDPSGAIIYVINERYMAVMKELGSIQRSIDALSANIKNQIFKDAMQRRYEEQIALYNATDATLRQIIRICGNKRYNELSEEEMEDVEALLNMWYLAPVRGNNVITEVMNMLDMSLMTFDTGSSYPEVYDQVAYQAYPFEHMGYDMRETIRCVDALTIAESYIMSCMWFQLHGGDKLFSERHQALNDKLTSYAAILDAHQVVRQTEYTVSQVKGFHQGRKLNMKFINAKDPYEFFDGRKDNFDWRKFSGEKYKTSDSQVLFKNMAENLYTHMTGDAELATRDEYHALWEFCGGRKSVSQIFKDAGFECTPFILSYHDVADFHWHHFEYNGFKLDESGRRYDMCIDMVQSDGTCPGTAIFTNSCFYNPDNGKLTLGDRQNVTYSFPDWRLF